jgi:hypothetical protein
MWLFSSNNILLKTIAAKASKHIFIHLSSALFWDIIQILDLSIPEDGNDRLSGSVGKGLQHYTA